MKENTLNNSNETPNKAKAKGEAIVQEQNKQNPSTEKTKDKELFKNFTEGKKKKKNFLDEYI